MPMRCSEGSVLPLEREAGRPEWSFGSCCGFLVWWGLGSFGNPDANQVDFLDRRLAFWWHEEASVSREHIDEIASSTEPGSITGPALLPVRINSTVCDPQFRLLLQGSVAGQATRAVSTGLMSRR